MFNILLTAEKIHRFINIYNTLVKICSEISTIFPTDFSDQKKLIEKELGNPLTFNS